ncbi:MAG TPA: hypothetical protein VK633_09955 [Verrucomicrobiae bacterium]|nr:hypothetical protein [Verrucomicrobiae bacterium]
MGSPEYYVFTLYVADRSEKSLKVYERLAQLCFRHLPGKHLIKLVDLHELGDQGDRYRVATSGPGILGAIPAALGQFIEGLSFDNRFFLRVEKAA